jgi:hypothetical protein
MNKEVKSTSQVHFLKTFVSLIGKTTESQVQDHI